MNRLQKTVFHTSLLFAIVAMAFYGGTQKNSILQSLGVERLHASDVDKPFDEQFQLLYEAYKIIQYNYLEQVDSDEMQKKILYGSIRGMLKSLGDQYTRFMDPQAYTNMSIDTKGKFGGVGIVIGIRNEQLTVISTLEGTPAFKAGIKSGDIIIKIDDKTTEDMALVDAVARIRGHQGEKVTLSIWRPGFDNTDGKKFEIIRDVIELKPINKSKMIEDNIGYIKLETFSEISETELKTKIEEFSGKGMKAMILDLRYNPGGLLPSAIDVANLFLDEGPIVHRVNRDGKAVTYYAKRGRKVVDVPVVVLVNKYSASASEIVAGALQDHGVATLIGEKTFGKGLVQTIYRLGDDSAILVTTDKYLTAMKHDINKTGIEPNITITQDSVNAKETNPYEDESDNQKPGTVGKFKISDLEGKNGVIYNGSPLKDIRYEQIGSKKYLGVDDVAKLFGATVKLDDKTGILDIETKLDDTENEDEKNDVQLKKAVEFLKDKISKKTK